MRIARGALLCVVLSFIGIGLCAYLTFLHLALLRGELLGGSACGVAGSIFNCHAVTASSFGSIAGLPLSLWGLIGYVATLSFAVIAWQITEVTQQALTALLGLGLAFVVVDVALLVVMLTQIHYLCPLCLGTNVVNVLLVVAAKWALQSSWATALQRLPLALSAWLPRRQAPAAWGLWGVVLTAAFGSVAVQISASYMIQGAPGALHKQMLQFISQQQRVTVATDGDPVKGAATPSIQMVEFSDFMCPSCQRASQLNPIFLAGHRHDAALIFKNYPLDQACNTSMKRTVHPNSCRVAAAAECAHEQGKFWELHDLIFAKAPPYDPANLTPDAQRIGLDVGKFQACLDSGRGMEAVIRDVQEGNRLNVTSTPTHIINGMVIPGVLTPAALNDLISALRESGHVSAKQ